MVELDFVNETDLSVNQKALIDHLELILRRLSHPDTVKLEIKIVGDTAIQQLNARYLQKNEVTDVLSFNAPDNSEQLLGSIAICAPRAEAQAKQAGISSQAEVHSLAGHGLLHLLGYHHQ